MDVAAVFSWFAQESLWAAQQTTDPIQREIFLKLAVLWGATAQDCRHEPATAQSARASG